MNVHHVADTVLETIAPGRTRYLANSDHLMLVVVDFDDGPAAVPDLPHFHPHEQVTYVVVGEVIFFVDGQSTHLKPGDWWLWLPVCRTAFRRLPAMPACSTLLRLFARTF